MKEVVRTAARKAQNTLIRPPFMCKLLWHILFLYLSLFNDSVSQMANFSGRAV